MSLSQTTMENPVGTYRDLLSFVPTCDRVADFHAKLETVSPSHFTNDMLQANSQEFLDLSWQMRLALHQSIPQVDRTCVLQIQKIFNTLRDLDDYFLQFAYQVPTLNASDVSFQKQPVPILDSQFYPAMWVRPGFEVTPFQFRPGDLAIARGVSFISAIISQISDPKSHFSHSVFFAVDSTSGLRKTVEAYVGAGVKSFDLEYALKNENARLLVLRPKDPGLGIKAMSYALKDAEEKKLYDYDMNFEDDRERSCVELPVSAYSQASGGILKLPIYRSQLKINNTRFLDQLRMKKGELITPDDLEIDPNFDLILDWKDARLIRDSRHKDAVLDSLIQWIDQRRYGFHGGWQAWVALHILQPLSQTPAWEVLKKIPGIPQIDKNTPKSVVEVMASLNQVAGTLLNELKEKDEAYLKTHQRPMTNEQLRKALEDLRALDESRYLRDERTLFHSIFHADK